MRGRIIHYNPIEGRGLLSGGGRQYPFEVADWQSEMAPALNAAVEFTVSGDRPVSVSRVPGETLLREKMGGLARRVGARGADASSGEGDGLAVGYVARLGKPLLIAQTSFVIGALLPSYVSLGMEGVERSYTLAALSHLSRSSALEIGSTCLVWVAFFAPGVPLVWRNRWCWLALLMPAAAVAKSWWDLRHQLLLSTNTLAVGGEPADQLPNQINAMVELGPGAWVCGLAALVLAGSGLARSLRGGA